MCSLETAGDANRNQHSHNAHKLATELLLELGVVNAKLVRGDVGEPIWPVGFSGSISHCRIGRRGKSNQALVAVAVCNAGHLIGIDVESIERCAQARRIQHMVHTVEEQALLDQLGQIGSLLGFSAKEAIYKALYPSVKKKFGFSAVTLVSIGHEFLEFKPNDFLIQHGFHFLPPVGWRYLEENAILTLLHHK